MPYQFHKGSTFSASWLGFAERKCLSSILLIQAGLHYLTDIRELKNGRAKIFDRLIEEPAFCEKLLYSDFYNRIHERVKHLANLESIIDSNKTIFKYNDNERSFSKIKADFLIKNSEEYANLFLFLAYRNETECFCRSFFPDNRVDYSENQITMSLLRKKKIYISTGEEIVLYDYFAEKAKR